MYKRPSVLRLIMSVMVSVLLTSCISALDRAMLPGPRFVTIVEEGRSNVVIIIPLKATASEVAAASDLEKYLEMVTRANINTIRETPPESSIAPFTRKIPVYVGNCGASRHLQSRTSRLISDGYVIEIKEDSLHLLGKNGLGTRFAVYGFLEDYIGVHWYLPEVFSKCCFPKNMGTYMPERDTIILKTGLDAQDPSFKYRKIGEPDDLWTIQNRMNFTWEDENGLQIHKKVHSFHQFVNPNTEGIDSDFFARYYGERRDDEVRNNRCQERSAMVDGRLRDLSELQTLQEFDRRRLKLNVGNLSVKDVMAREIINYIDDNPRIDIVNIFPNDGLCFDESPESKVLDGENFMGYSVEDVNDRGRRFEEEFGRVLSKRYTMFYHDVTDMVLAERPDKILMTGAYSAYQYAPLEVDEPDFIWVQILSSTTKS